jgi:hypothetical protein
LKKAPGAYYVTGLAMFWDRNNEPWLVQANLTDNGLFARTLP